MTAPAPTPSASSATTKLPTPPPSPLELRDARSLGGAIVLAGGNLKLTTAASTAFGNNLKTTANATIDLGARLAHSLGALSIGQNTLTVTGSGSSLAFGGLTKSGAGALTLSGANAYTGATTISRGILQLGASERISDTSAVSISSGATLNPANYNKTSGSLAGAGSVSLGSGTLTTGSNNASSTFSGIVSGTGQLIKSGTGALTLTGPNSFTGAATISGGVLNARNVNAFGTTTGGVTVSSGATLELQGNVAIGAEGLILNGTGIGGAGALRNISGENS